MPPKKLHIKQLPRRTRTRNWKPERVGIKNGFGTRIEMTEPESFRLRRCPTRLLTRFFSPPAAPKVERQDETSCDVSWEPLAPMKGDPVLYNLQCMMGNSDFKQVQ